MKPVKPSSKIFLLAIQMWIIYVISVLFLLCLRVCLFFDALCSLAGKKADLLALVSDV